MKARVEKYYNDNENYVPRRTKKNEQLYEEIKDTELENLSIGSNAKVLGDHQNQIDIDKIKELLEKNYQAPPKRRTAHIPVVEEEPYELEKTREYDINAILEKAREEKKIDYQEERLKKVRDTQYDILKDLELKEENKSKAANEKTKEELLELINTINLNEYQKKEKRSAKQDTKELDPLDILSDLKGHEDTVVVGAKELSEEMEAQEEKNLNLEQSGADEDTNEQFDESFYTTSMSFTKDDFADFDDLEEGSKLGNLVVKGLIVIIFFAIVAGVILFLNDFLKLGWF